MRSMKKILLTVMILGSLLSSFAFAVTPVIDYNYPWVLDPNNLLRDQLASYTATGNFNQEGCVGESAFVDGSFNTSHPDYKAILGTWENNSVIEYQLDTSVNTNGYTVSSIQVYGGWPNDGRDKQSYSVYFSVVGSTTWFFLGSVSDDPPDPYTYEHVAFATNMQNVDAVKLVAPATGVENGYVGIGEIVALGTPSGTPVASYTWDGGGDGTTWSDPNNWNPVGLPGPLSDVEISDIPANIIVDDGALAKSLTIDAVDANAITLTITDMGNLTVLGAADIGTAAGLNPVTVNIDAGGELVMGGQLTMGSSAGDNLTPREDLTPLLMNVEGDLKYESIYMHAPVEGINMIDIIQDGALSDNQVTNTKLFVNADRIIGNGGTSLLLYDETGTSGYALVVTAEPPIEQHVIEWTFDSNLENWHLASGADDATLVWQDNGGAGEMLLSYQDDGSGAMSEVQFQVGGLSIDPTQYHYLRIKYRCSGFPQDPDTTFHLRWFGSDTGISLNTLDDVSGDVFVDQIVQIYPGWKLTEAWGWSKEWSTCGPVHTINLVLPDWNTEGRTNPANWNGASIAIDSIALYNLNPLDPAKSCWAERPTDPMDFNDDCIVDLLDFADFAQDWLSDTYVELP